MTALLLSWKPFQLTLCCCWYVEQKTSYWVKLCLVHIYMLCVYPNSIYGKMAESKF